MENSVVEQPMGEVGSVDHMTMCFDPADGSELQVLVPFLVQSAKSCLSIRVYKQSGIS